MVRMIKKVIGIFALILILNISLVYSLDEEIVISCFGDDQLIGTCFGDTEINPTKQATEPVSVTEEKTEINYILIPFIVLIFFIFSITILLLKKRRDKSNRKVYNI